MCNYDGVCDYDDVCDYDGVRDYDDVCDYDGVHVCVIVVQGGQARGRVFEESCSHSQAVYGGHSASATLHRSHQHVCTLQ